LTKTPRVKRDRAEREPARRRGRRAVSPPAVPVDPGSGEAAEEGGGRRAAGVGSPRAREPRDRAWSRGRLAERSVLVGVSLPNSGRAQTEEHLDELARLADTAGAQVVGRLLQERDQPDVRTFIGRGKVTELRQLCDHLEANLVIFDDTLSPAQARNLETVLERSVVDRSELILDIFARHARSRSAMLQVELAQLEYMRPRLRRLWDHLSRQDGGIGTRGPGETQLEVDRRRVGERISHLKRELHERDRIAEVQRKSRREEFRVALVGYTNAGKSSLMNALAGTDLLVEDQLFSTLDATTRRLALAGGAQVLLTDTVGFIRKLPHDLVASFRSTLAEIQFADLLLHVCDVTSPAFSAHVDTVHTVLDEIMDGRRDSWMVFNKIDALHDPAALKGLLRHHPGAFPVSARTGEGLEALRSALEAGLRARTVEVKIEVLRRAGEVLAFCYREGRVESQEATRNGQPRLGVRFPVTVFRRFAKRHDGDYRLVRGDGARAASARRTRRRTTRRGDAKDGAS
jgi:GTP-binding protein HflX